MAQQQPHILIVGAAYAGISAFNSLVNLSAGKSQAAEGGLPGGPPGGKSHGPPGIQPPPEILRALRTKPKYTILDERDGFYHTVGAPLGQVNPSYAREFWIRYEDILKDRALNEDVRFVQGAASDLDTNSKMLKYLSPEKNDDSISYDFLVVATGMRRGFPVVPEAVQEIPYLEDVEKFIAPLKNASRIVLVGGGAVGIEMAAEAKRNFPQSEVVLIHSRDTLLSNEPLPDAYKSKALDILLEQGVQVRFGIRVQSEQKASNSTELSLSNGENLTCDHVIYTAQQRGANTQFLPQSSDIVDAKGCIKVRETLQFPASLPNADFHYAVGDVASWSGIKRSGPSQNMGKFAAANIVNSLIALEDGKDVSQAELGSCPPNPNGMSLAIGDQAIGMRFGDMRWGKEVKQRAFGRGLGIDGTLQKLQIKPKSFANNVEVDQTQVDPVSVAPPVAANM